MLSFSELFVCLVTFVVAEALRHEISSIAGEDAVLRCAAEPKAGVQYRSVIWYKVDEEKSSQQLTGLVKKRLTENGGKLEKYKGFEREIVLLESSKSIVLSNVTTEDSGIYRCFLSAPIGHQNQQGETILKVYESLTVEFYKSDLVYISEVAAIVGLFAGFLFFCLAYVCIRNMYRGNKKLSLLKMPHQGKNLINTNHLVCKTLPDVCV